MIDVLTAFVFVLIVLLGKTDDRHLALVRLQPVAIDQVLDDEAPDLRGEHQAEGGCGDPCLVGGLKP